jgi:hypothetical protein
MLKKFSEYLLEETSSADIAGVDKKLGEEDVYDNFFFQAGENGETVNVTKDIVKDIIDDLDEVDFRALLEFLAELAETEDEDEDYPEVNINSYRNLMTEN